MPVNVTPVSEIPVSDIPDSEIPDREIPEIPERYLIVIPVNVVTLL